MKDNGNDDWRVTKILANIRRKEEELHMPNACPYIILIDYLVGGTRADRARSCCRVEGNEGIRKLALILGLCGS